MLTRKMISQTKYAMFPWGGKGNRGGNGTPRQKKTRGDKKITRQFKEKGKSLELLGKREESGGWVMWG